MDDIIEENSVTTEEEKTEVFSNPGILRKWGNKCFSVMIVQFCADSLMVARE